MWNWSVNVEYREKNQQLEKTNIIFDVTFRIHFYW